MRTNATARRFRAVKDHVPLTVDAFNALVPEGTHVLYYPIIGQPEHVSTFTRSEAWELPGGEAVVLLNGWSGAVTLRALVKP